MKKERLTKPPFPSPQINQQGQLRHFLNVDHLTPEHIHRIFDITQSFLDDEAKLAEKTPLLKGKTVVNMFFETSTRTRSTFELAAKRLSADVLNLDIKTAAVQKGESLLDTLQNMQAMGADMFVFRHRDSGAAEFIAQHVNPGVAVINAGDGSHAHPTQAVLDAFTIKQHKGSFENLKIAIVGDIRHSRVARSQMTLLQTLGVKDIRVIGPKTLIPSSVTSLGVKVHYDCAQGIADCDVVMMLRLQKERMIGSFIPSEGEYYKHYGLTAERLALAADDAIVMHPGPINREIEISSLVADGKQSVILEQVACGIAVRMAVMTLVVDGQQQELAG